MVGKYDNLRSVVLGAGASGRAAALLLRARGNRVTLLDEGRVEPQVAAELTAVGVEVVEDATQLPPESFELCVVSPGVPDTHAWVRECQRRGVKAISELELGASYWSGRIVAVTGSKGKSSLVKLCAEALTRGGIGAVAAGNYGTPLSQVVYEGAKWAWAVVEVSSFQMELTESLAPEIAVLLNIQADHLDRHGDMDNYRHLKLKLFQAMVPGSLVLLPPELEIGGSVPAGVAVERFGTHSTCEWRYVAAATGGRVVGAQGEYTLHGSWFDNVIFGVAAAAAVAVLRRVGVARDVLEASFKEYAALPHRMELIGVDERGVRYVNDSKATNLSALAAALKMSGTGVRLIAGGVLKEPNLKDVKELLTRHTKKVYIVGKCCEEMFQAWSGAANCEVCGTLECAVRRAVCEAQPDEVVLLAPGTASFDQFSGFRERGERFVEMVRAVAHLKRRNFSGSGEKERQ